jgi:hypothetical protein
VYDVMAAIGCLAALDGGTAMPPTSGPTPTSSIGSLTGRDVFSNSIPMGRHHQWLTGADVLDNTIWWRRHHQQLPHGADINESSLNLP